MVLRSIIKSNTLILQFWLLTVLSIVLLSVFGRKLQSAIVSRIDIIWVAAAVFIILFLTLLLLLKNRANNGIKKRVLLISSLLLVGGGAALYFEYLVPVEAVHFLVFSYLGWLSAAVFGPIAGIGAVVSIAVGDEILQYFLPDRVGDFHDIAVNLVSGLTGILIRGK